MKNYICYYLVSGDHIISGPFPTIEYAVANKNNYIPPQRELLTIVKSVLPAVEV
jgi:hypothetical protein